MERPPETPEPLAGHRQQRVPERLYRLLVESVRDYAIFLLDPSGCVQTWNPGAERLKGYRADEILGEHFSRFYPPEDVAAGKPYAALEVALRDGRFEEEGWRVRKDGTRFWADVVISPVRDGDGALIGFAKVTRDLTERKRAEEQRMRLAATEAEVRVRDEFLLITAHELRTPLTALQLQLHLLKPESPPEAMAARIAKARRSTDRLTHLVEALLDVSRIATGKLALRREKLDLVALALDVADRMRGQAEQAGCRLSVSAPGELCGTWDRLRLEEVVANILSNAFKYGAGTRVHLEVRREGADAVLEISDHGPGIAPQDQQRVFGRFERAASRNYGGLGMGLYVSREIVRAHGGHIAASGTPGGGATITARLPISPPA